MNRSRTVVASDLDRTLVYSSAALALAMLLTTLARRRAPADPAVGPVRQVAGPSRSAAGTGGAGRRRETARR